MNRQYNEGRRDDMLPDIATQAGMDLDGATATASTFVFPSVEEQLSDAWLGGFMATNFKEATDKRAESGEITALDSYEGAINASYLQAASQL
jgi:taurine transport system substrate-binding protein